MARIDDEFWHGKRVLVTGHTGFKGAWLAAWLSQLGAEVSGYSLPPEGEPNLYGILQTPFVEDIHADLRDHDHLAKTVVSIAPEIAFHLASQALVRKSYQDPLETISTNVLGTANLLNAFRSCPTLRAAVVVTSDKVYSNEEAYRAGGTREFREDDPLGGHDPYSASKGMQELVTRSFADSFLTAMKIPVATARAGNVIGGGDWAPDRLMTDIVDAVSRKEPVVLRNPLATRPWQHVLEPLAGYLLYAQALTTNSTGPRSLNFGPDGSETVQNMVESFLQHWCASSGWTQDGDPGPQEAQTLALDSTLAKSTLGWQPRLTPQETIQWTADWYKAHGDGKDMAAFTVNQIREYQARTDTA